MNTNQSTIDLLTYLSVIMVMFLTGTQEQIPFFWMSILLLGVFGSLLFILFEQPSPAYRKKRRRRCRPHPNWKRVMKWCRRALPLGLVRRCRRRPIHRPPSLDGSFFPSPHCNRLQRWRRRRARARAFLAVANWTSFWVVARTNIVPG